MWPSAAPALTPASGCRGGKRRASSSWCSRCFRSTPWHCAHRHAHRAARLRSLDLAAESDALIEVEATDADGFEPVGYRTYLREQHARYRALHSAGQLQWFGVECDGVLAATCGLVRDRVGPGADGRFQRVVTHAAWRRRGLASLLVHGVSRFAFERWQVGALYMAADPDDVAIGIYRSLGFVDLSRGAGLQRNAPQDRPQAAATASAASAASAA